MKLSSNKPLFKRFLDRAIPILVSRGAFYITLACILLDIVLIFKFKRAGEISLVGDILFFLAILIAHWYVRHKPD